jgi:hypothetical protein
VAITSTRIDLTAWPAGTYVIRLRIEEGEARALVVKQ